LGAKADIRRQATPVGSVANDPTATWLLARASCNRRPTYFDCGKSLADVFSRYDVSWLDRRHLVMEETMGRKFIDCRQFPSEMNCTIAISADTEAELLDAAVQHAVAVHRHQDTPELRDQIKSAMKEGTPP
jgi:predicted small metal-binding protein